MAIMSDDDRPETLGGPTVKIQTACGNMYIVINDLRGNPREVFITMGKSGNCTMSTMSGFARTVSISLRTNPEHALDILEEISDTLVGMRCNRSVEMIERCQTESLSCCDAVGRVFRWYVDYKRGKPAALYSKPPPPPSAPDQMGVSASDAPKPCQECGTGFMLVETARPRREKCNECGFSEVVQ